MPIRDVRLPTPRAVVFDPIALGTAMAAPAVAKAKRREELESKVFGDLVPNIIGGVEKYKKTKFEEQPISNFVSPERLQEIGLKPETPIKLIKDMTDVLGGKGLSLEDRLAIIDAQAKRQSAAEAAKEKSKKSEEASKYIQVLINSGKILSEYPDSEAALNAKSIAETKLRELGYTPEEINQPENTWQKIFGAFKKIGARVSPVQPQEQPLQRRTFQAPPQNLPQSGQGKIYNNPNEVKADYKAGKITEAQATQIIKEKFPGFGR